MSFFSRNKRKHVEESGYGYHLHVPSAEAPRIRFSPATVERIARERAKRASTRPQPA
jgi:hypothetical protein